MQQITQIVDTYFKRMPSIRWTDIVEVIIISFLVYHILVWIKNTKAWSLLKGIVVIAIFLLLAAIFHMNTILWIAENVVGIAVTAIVVILQPELRKALEELGRKNIISSIIPFEYSKPEEGLFSDRTINEITKACVEMGKVKTGALIVVEQTQPLAEYERTDLTWMELFPAVLINISSINHRCMTLLLLYAKSCNLCNLLSSVIR